MGRQRPRRGDGPAGRGPTAQRLEDVQHDEQRAGRDGAEDRGGVVAQGERVQAADGV